MDSQRVNPISIRQATIHDIDDLSVLFDGYRQFYGRDSDVQGARLFLSERFQHGQSLVFIAHAGATPVGFTQLYPSFSSVSMARIYILNDLFVSEAGRRKGVGAALLGTAVDFGRRVGAVRLGLSTGKMNASAQSLYEAQGWKRDDDYFYYNCMIPG